MTNFDERYWSSRVPGSGARATFGPFGDFVSSVLRVLQIKSLLRTTKKYVPNGCLLDAGCGLGHFMSLARATYHSYGFDISEFAVSSCKRQGLDVLVSSAEAPCFKDESFDVITSLDVLEHLCLPSLAVEKLSRLLKPNGVLIIRTPNLSGIGARILNKDWFAYRDPTHISLGRRHTWVKLLEDNGLRVERAFSDSLFFLILGENNVASAKAVLRYLPLFALGLLSLMGFGLGIRYPAVGENLCVVARKRQD